MKPYIWKVNLFFVVITSILLVSCKDNEDSYFARSGYWVNCFLDSNQVYFLEETVGRTLDASCSISNENDDVAEIQIDKETGKHVVVPKKIGCTHAQLVKGEEKTSVIIVVKTAAIDFWKIADRIEKIDCTSELKENIRFDIYESQVLPQLSVDGELVPGYNSKGKWYMGCSSDNGGDRKNFYVDYAKGDAEYEFYAWPDIDKKQSFTFSLDEVRRPSGEEPMKYGTFTCDLTDYYQQQYGQDNVRRVILSYKVRSFRMIF